MPAVAGTALAGALPYGAALQRKPAPGGAAVREAAGAGVAGPAGALPYREHIQTSFGRHDVGDVAAHVGGAAREAAESIGARAYATGRHVAFRDPPDLHTAAHEAAHVIQQGAGVHLAGGVGQAGDGYEQHADAVADRVVQGRSAEDLLDRSPGQSGGAGEATDAAPAPADGSRVLAEEAERALEELIASVEAAQKTSPAPPSSDAGSSGGSGAGHDSGAPSGPLGDLRSTLERFRALRASGRRPAVSAAAREILAAVRGESGGESGATGGTARTDEGAPVQKFAMAIPVVVTAPEWVPAALAGIGAALLYLVGREATRSDAVPRVVPRTREQDETPRHRGRIQVQGEDLAGEISFPWAQSTPMTKLVALAELKTLQALLKPRELALRDQAFRKAEKFILSTLYTAPPLLTRTFQNSNLIDSSDRKERTARVDVEIRMGTAFA